MRGRARSHHALHRCHRLSLHPLLPALLLGLAVAPTLAQDAPDQVLLARAYAAHEAGRHDTARGLFAEVAGRYLDTAAAPEADTMLGYYLAAEGRFEEAAAAFVAAAQHPAAAPDVAAEAALQAGAACLWRYLAEQAVAADGTVEGPASHRDKLALLILARQRFQAIADLTAEAPGSLNATAWAYAVCKLAEVDTLQGEPEAAAARYRTVLQHAAQRPGELPATLRTLAGYGLGTTLLHLGRPGEAQAVLAGTRAGAATGTVLRRVAVPEVVVGWLDLTEAQALARVRRSAEALVAVERCLAAAPTLSRTTAGQRALADAQALRQRLRAQAEGA